MASKFTSHYQHTLAIPISCLGIGLHTGEIVHLTLHPAEVNTGVVFQRKDLDGEQAIVKGDCFDVMCTTLGTVLENEYGVKVSTVEHLMAALWGLGVDNVRVELNGPEVPIMDGSSDPFVFLIECAGIVEQEAFRHVIEVLKPVSVESNGNKATIVPHQGFSLDVEINFDHKLIGRQHKTYDFSKVEFKQILSRARSFGFKADVEKLHSMGLARGGSLENAIVLDEEQILNEEGLRYADEFIRHKALDCVGDYFLCGARIEGKVTTYRPGHGINNELVRALLSDESAWQFKPLNEPHVFVTSSQPQKLPTTL